MEYLTNGKSPVSAETKGRGEVAPRIPFKGFFQTELIAKEK